MCRVQVQDVSSKTAQMALLGPEAEVVLRELAPQVRPAPAPPEVLPPCAQPASCARTCHDVKGAGTPPQPSLQGACCSSACVWRAHRHRPPQVGRCPGGAASACLCLHTCTCACTQDVLSSLGEAPGSHMLVGFKVTSASRWHSWGPRGAALCAGGWGQGPVCAACTLDAGRVVRCVGQRRHCRPPSHHQPPATTIRL